MAKNRYVVRQYISNSHIIDLNSKKFAVLTFYKVLGEDSWSKKSEPTKCETETRQQQKFKLCGKDSGHAAVCPSYL
jgi:hypothetical protein